MHSTSKLQKGAVAWAMYDWGNSAFATTVMAALFPIFFKEYYSAGVEATDTTFRLGLAVSAAGIIIAIVAPLLGTIAGRTGKKRHFVFGAAALGAGATLSLVAVESGGWLMAAALYCLALVGFLGGNIFYDALLVEVSSESDVHKVSSLGYALGYVGGGMLFLLNVLWILDPEAFGMADKAVAIKASFASVGIWWLLFTLPMLFRVQERTAAEPVALIEAFKGSWQRTTATFRDILNQKNIALFLFAYWCYIDGVDTVITMSVDYMMSIGAQSGDLIAAILIVQFVSFPAAYIVGVLGQRWNVKYVILMCIAVYIGVTLFASRLDMQPLHIAGFTISKIYLFAVLIALVQGGIQALSRSYFATLIKPEQAGSMFGFYNMLGKFAAIVGPLLVGTTAVLTGDPRSSILSLSLLFIVGGVALWKVKN